MLTLAEWTGARVHIAHHSAADSLFVLRDAKRRGVDVTVETCPQYLLLQHRHMSRWAASCGSTRRSARSATTSRCGTR